MQSQRGFTMVELIMVIVIAGILAAVAAPRFFEADVFKVRGFVDQVQASLRYAQKSAIAQRRWVCVEVTAPSASSAKVALMITAAAATVPACAATLNLPASSDNFVESSDVTATPASFTFDALGRPFSLPFVTGSPSVAQSVTIADYTITVERETGYVH